MSGRLRIVSFEFAFEIVHLDNRAHVPLKFTKFPLLVLAHPMRHP